MRTVSPSTQKELSTRTWCPVAPTTMPIRVDSKLQRGVIRWVREQAYQTEHDSGRVWNGAVAEYRSLQNGLHPDPNPGAIIFPDEPEKFDTQDLDIDIDYLERADDMARIDQKHEDYLLSVGVPLDHSQLLAALCRMYLDEIIDVQESKVRSRDKWLEEHPEWFELNPDWTPPEELDHEQWLDQARRLVILQDIRDLIDEDLEPPYSSLHSRTP